MSTNITPDTKTAVCGVVNQCYHEGCQWRDLSKENQRLRELVAELKARAATAQKQIADIAAQLSAELQWRKDNSV